MSPVQQQAKDWSWRRQGTRPHGTGGSRVQAPTPLQATAFALWLISGRRRGWEAWTGRGSTFSLTSAQLRTGAGQNVCL